MKKQYAVPVFRKIVVPVMYCCDNQAALAAAKAIADSKDQILLVGMVAIPENDSLSTAALPARQVRKSLQELGNDARIRIYEKVRASYRPWEDLLRVVQQEEPDLLVMGWPDQFEACCTTPAAALAHPPCDLVVASGPVPDRPHSVLVSMRGGPYAELCLRLSLSIADANLATVTALHLVPSTGGERQDAPFRGLERVLANLPDIDQVEMPTDDPVGTIIATAQQHDLIVMGATARSGPGASALGPVAEQILQTSRTGVLIVKTRRPMPVNLESEAAGQYAISVLVDQWFAENTYHAEEFSDLEELLAQKVRQGLTISLALPALNEEETVGSVIQTLHTALVKEVPLLDEIVLIDSDSSDRTREIAAGLGVPVYIHQQLLPRLGARHGKGEALWKSLYVTRGDIVLWLDTDIVNMQPSFVYGLLGPLLHRPDIQFVKGFYRRPLKVGEKMQAGGGGRVTELTARPLLNLFYPEISGVIQPLSGEYGGRRTALEQLPFFSGYGVEIGLLIDIFEKFSLNAIAQVDLQERIHHNQSLESLSKMSFAIIQAVIGKLEQRYGRDMLDELNKTMKLIRYESGRLFLEVEEIAEGERPPMRALPEYQERSLQWPV